MFNPWGDVFKLGFRQIPTFNYDPLPPRSICLLVLYLLEQSRGLRLLWKVTVDLD